jgi:hypothetical protein
MAELKTRPSDGSVERFLSTIGDKSRRGDCRALAELMQQITKAPPRMWGSSIVGFGSYHYKYASGREGDWFLTGFSPRKQNLTLYIMGGFEGYPELMKALGKYTTAKSCLYVKSLEDIHLPTLKKLIRESVRHLQKSST